VAHTHEVPNHLNVEDTLFLGLNARQVATFMAFASPAYGIWDQLTVAPTPVRGALAGLLLLVGIGFALVQPGNRPLDEWVFAILAHAVTPRQLRWCRPEPDSCRTAPPVIAIRHPASQLAVASIFAVPSHGHSRFHTNRTLSLS
jgi:hypothetical protein